MASRTQQQFKIKKSKRKSEKKLLPGYNAL
jgi:hypothetical protein